MFKKSMLHPVCLVLATISIFTCLSLSALTTEARTVSASSYTCWAINPFVFPGAIVIAHKEDGRGGETSMAYGLLNKKIRSTALNFSADNLMSFPEASVETVDGIGMPSRFRLLLMRPLRTTGTVYLSGVTFRPNFMAVPNPQFMLPFQGGVALPLVPVPAGGVVTTVVTCKVEFP